MYSWKECFNIRCLKTITRTKTLYLPPTKFSLLLRNVYYQIINLLKSQQRILMYIHIDRKHLFLFAHSFLFLYLIFLRFFVVFLSALCILVPV